MDVIDFAQHKWLILGGSDNALAELSAALPASLAQRAIAELSLSPQAEPLYIIDCVLDAMREHETRVETQRVAQLISGPESGTGAALGLGSTLHAIMKERVNMLILEESFKQAGWRCPDCRFLTEKNLGFCPVCGVDLSLRSDIVELAVEHVVNHESGFDVLRSPKTRHALADYGHIGALLEQKRN